MTTYKKEGDCPKRPTLRVRHPQISDQRMVSDLNLRKKLVGNFRNNFWMREVKSEPEEIPWCPKGAKQVSTEKKNFNKR